jgi:hypothetical protein
VILSHEFFVSFLPVAKLTVTQMKSIRLTCIRSRAVHAYAKKLSIVGYDASPFFATRSHHGWDKHGSAFAAVVVIVQYQMDLGSPIFAV